MSKRDRIHDRERLQSVDTVDDGIGDDFRQCDAHPDEPWIRMYVSPGTRTIRACAECVAFLDSETLH